MLLIARFTVTDPEPFTARAERALGLLLAQPGCVRGLLVRSTEDAGSWVLTVEFESVAAYRRSLSPFDVRTEVIPFLAEADTTEPAAFEVVVEAAPGSVRRHTSLLAADAGTVRLGEAAGPTTAR
ncbi:antibiotic biosynthesis monooxygenase [Actinokineospora sp. PR83]|uniref:antibiotic biosynthesis monooxygenase family protein n=1 Tax=Actinokineospora sp. PR83 TaxID=2884908 RepID=UPI0027E213F2|nr:antibiotic biosynthesis monooxygenase family protein [Actinokineospora sp. PR83]MCG8916982.1 antibiotic biosynthesis monooxygenase [Actinokineospora sp. PR83]